MDIPITRPEMPEEGKPSLLAKSAMIHLSKDVKPQLDTAFSQSRAEDVAILVECMDREQRFGQQFKRIECEEISQLLDTNIENFEEAMTALNRAILDERLEDSELVPYLARKSYRDEWLYKPVTRLYPDRSWSALD